MIDYLSMTKAGVRSPLRVVTVALFLDFVSLTLAIPLLAFWAGRLGATPVVVGTMVTAYAAAQLVFTPVLGALSDRYGRKPVLVTSLVLSATSFVLTALAGSLAMLFVARIVGGLGGSIVGAAHAIIADRFDATERVRAMGYAGAAIGLAHVIGPALGGALSTLGATVPFWSGAVLAFTNAAVIYRWLPETRHRPNARNTDNAWWRSLFQSSAMRRLTVLALIFALIAVTLETVLALFTNRALGWVELQNGWLFAYLGVTVVAMQLGVAARAVVRFGELRVLRTGLAAVALGLLLLSVSSAVASAIIAVGLIGIGSGAISPLLPTLFAAASPADDRGAVLGFAQGLTALARLIGPLLASGLFTWRIGSPFIVTGLLCVLGVFLVTDLQSKPRGDDHAQRPPPPDEPDTRESARY